MNSCEHLNFAAEVNVNRIVDKGRFSADVRIRCAECGMPFRFIGASAGYSPDRPTVNVDGTTLCAPIEPEIVKILHTDMKYDMR